jgi:hypothetical protein
MNNIIFSLAAILSCAAFCAQAQLSTIPKRHRSAPSYVQRQSETETVSSPVGFEGRQAQNQRQTGQNNSRRKKRRKLVMVEIALPSQSMSFDLSMPPIEQSEFGTIVPASSMSMMSLSLVESEYSLSMPPLGESEFGNIVPVSSMSMMLLSLDESELSLSLPMFDFPKETLIDEPVAEIVSLDRSNASTLILCSFVAGLSALVVGATALFLKMQRVHAQELERSQARHVFDLQVARCEVAV